MIKKVVMFHYRFGKTDGVSLQMAAWKKILSEAGIVVEVCAGPVSEGANYVIETFEPQLNPAAFKLNRESYGKLNEYDEATFAREFKQMTTTLYQEFKKVLQQSRPDRVMVSNVFSVGEHLPAAVALAQALEEAGIKTVAIHHDFYWEGIRRRSASCKLVEETLQKYFPPIGKWITHCCINSLAVEQLKARKGVEAWLLPDTHNFEIDYNDPLGECKLVLGVAGVTPADLVVLQATRIVRRKNIELAIDLVAALQKRVVETGKKRAILLMCGYAEKRDEKYLERLLAYAREKGVTVVHLQGISAAPIEGKCDLYNLYAHADVITYPSEYEGFGNQFLEAVAVRKPVVVFEYPVFEKDIKPLGFEIISLGNKLVRQGGQAGWAKVEEEVVTRAVGQIVEVLKSNDMRRQMVEKNYTLGSENFGFSAARKTLMRAFGE